MCRVQEGFPVIRIEIDDADPIAKQLMVLSASVQNRQEAAERENEARVVDMGEDGPPGSPEMSPRVARPPQARFEDVFRMVVATGAGELLSDGRFPNSVMNINELNPGPHRKGDIIRTQQISLPIGVELHTITATPQDGPNWNVQEIHFATLNLISPYGGPVPLSALTYLTQKDLLSVFAGKRTVVDVYVMMTLICKKDGATFDGFNLFLNEEEQPLRIQTRIREINPKPPPGVFGGSPGGMGPASFRGPMTYR
jgi:hypothetical protein